jgi:hypothetical protein
VKLLDRSECLALADRLGESPETVISVHLLRRGLCRVFADGEQTVIQNLQDPSEPMAFGDAPESIWHLLNLAVGWKCISVPSSCAEELGSLISRQMECKIRYYEDVYHTLTVPTRAFDHSSVRLLTEADLDTVLAAPREVQGAGFTDTKELLSNGVAAGAIVDDKLVAIAHTSAISREYADVGVCTLEPWQRKGISSSATYLVAQKLQSQGKIPTWSCGIGNLASLRVANKVGFKEVLRRTYVIPVT